MTALARVAPPDEKGFISAVNFSKYMEAAGP